MVKVTVKMITLPDAEKTQDDGEPQGLMLGPLL